MSAEIFANYCAMMKLYWDEIKAGRDGLKVWKDLDIYFDTMALRLAFVDAKIGVDDFVAVEDVAKAEKRKAGLDYLESTPDMHHVSMACPPKRRRRDEADNSDPDETQAPSIAGSMLFSYDDEL